MSLQRLLLAAAVLTLVSGGDRRAKGIIAAELTAESESSVDALVVVRNGYVEPERGWGQVVLEAIMPTSSVDVKRIKAVKPLDSLRVRTPARVFIYPHLGSMQIHAEGGKRLKVRITAWRGYEPQSGLGSDFEVRTFYGKATLEAGK